MGVLGLFTCTPCTPSVSQQTLILHYLQPFSAVLLKSTMLPNHTGKVLAITSL